MSSLNTDLGYKSETARANGFVHEKSLNIDAFPFIVGDAAPVMLWTALKNGFTNYCNKQWYEFTGTMRRANEGERWLDALNDDDREKCWPLWQNCLASGEAFESEQRLRRHDGEYRWMLVRAEPIFGSAGAIIRWVGTCVEIHDLRLAHEQCALINKELDHRVTNVFAIFGALMSLEARLATSPEALAESMKSRLASLNAAHLLIRRPANESHEFGATVHSVIQAVIEPYQSSESTRFMVSGTDRKVDDDVLTSIALLTHELCTNALKYGALTQASGKIFITTEVDGLDLKIDWVERGGPSLTGEEPIRSGFGTDLIRAAIEQQLGGTLTRQWSSEGISVGLRLPMARLHGDPRAGPDTKFS